MNTASVKIHNSNREFINSGLNQVKTGRLEYSAYNMRKLIDWGYVLKVPVNPDEYAGFGRPKHKYVLTRKGQTWLNNHQKKENDTMANTKRTQKPKFDILGSINNAVIALSTLAVNLEESDPDRAVFLNAKNEVQKALDIINRDISDEQDNSEDNSEDNQSEASGDAGETEAVQAAA
jgi:hypothetical protein